MQEKKGNYQHNTFLVKVLLFNVGSLLILLHNARFQLAWAEQVSQGTGVQILST